MQSWPLRSIRKWTGSEDQKLVELSKKLSDREIAIILGRTIHSIRSRRKQLGFRKLALSGRRWNTPSATKLKEAIVGEYLSGASQSELVRKYHVEWKKLRKILLEDGIMIRSISQQAFIKKFGRLPTIRGRLSKEKLYVIFAMLGDNLRPSSQVRRHTHIIGVAAGPDVEFAKRWCDAFEKEYSVCPDLRVLGPTNVQTYISSREILGDLHKYAIFGRYDWHLKDHAIRFLLNECPQEWLCSGLRGFFDAEGTPKYQRKRAARSVRAYSVNKNGLRQLQQLLQRIGIQTRHSQNELVICGRQNLIKFAQLIGFTSRYKMKVLKEMISSYRRGEKRRELIEDANTWIAHEMG